VDMGKGIKLIGSIIREIDRSQKAAARAQAKREREQIRRQKQIERERIQQAKEYERIQNQLNKEKIKEDKEKIRRDLEMEKIIFERRIQERREIRLNFLNRMQKGA